MLKVFVDICEKLELPYYLICGSALGAAKYQGFIPWDDDIDVGMFRKDYEIFCREAPGLLPEHLFLQNFRSDPEHPSLLTRLRNSNTTYVVKLYKERNIHHGVFIDILPLDVYPAENVEKFEKKHMHWARLRVAYLYEENCKITRAPRTVLTRKFMRLFAKNKIQSIMKKYEAFISDPSYSSDIICNHGNWQGKQEYMTRDKYGEGTMAIFEGLKVRIPSKYDEYLTQKYGDWRADLPEEEKKGHHYYEILDLDHPYTDYIEKISRDGRRIKLRKTLPPLVDG